jgi:hypothetical protein
MRLIGSDSDCRPLLDLGQIQRQLRLGSPIAEGHRTIVVAQVIGTVGRVQDFDGCFRPRNEGLRKRIDDIAAARPTSLDEPIDVVRLDRAYFVSDGHKRVSLARATGQEFIDAQVTRMDTRYAVTPEVDSTAIARTAREGEFRRHSGMAAVVPGARFALTDLSGYGELLMAVQGFAFDKVLETGRPMTAAESARLWYEEEYMPVVARGREAVDGLLDCLTDADVFLALHRQWRAWWGSECDEPGCAADQFAAEQRALASRSPLSRVLGRSPRPASDAPLLPLIDSDSPDAELAPKPDA